MKIKKNTNKDNQMVFWFSCLHNTSFQEQKQKQAVKSNTNFLCRLHFFCFTNTKTCFKTDSQIHSKNETAYTMKRSPVQTI